MDNFKEDCLATNLNFVEANRLVEDRRCWRSCMTRGLPEHRDFVIIAVALS